MLWFQSKKVESRRGILLCLLCVVVTRGKILLCRGGSVSLAILIQMGTSVLCRVSIGRVSICFCFVLVFVVLYHVADCDNPFVFDCD